MVQLRMKVTHAMELQCTNAMEPWHSIMGVIYAVKTTPGRSYVHKGGLLASLFMILIIFMNRG